nr:MAG TPA: hypothetical protein [Caudoviricetes sp.]
MKRQDGLVLYRHVFFPRIRAYRKYEDIKMID